MVEGRLQAKIFCMTAITRTKRKAPSHTARGEATQRRVGDAIGCVEGESIQAGSRSVAGSASSPRSTAAK
jgi:hypothetical protein